MPWREESIMDQREEFVLRAIAKEKSFQKLCDEYGITRATGYKWRDRFLDQGKAGLFDMSKRPLNSPAQLGEDIVIKILQIRDAHKSWGAKKIEKILENDKTIKENPSESSIYRILKKADRIKEKRVRKTDANKENLHKLIEPKEPNDVWTIDYKGWWLSSEIKRCNPLTIRDLHSRYNLDIRLTVRQDTESAMAAMEKVFKEYGLPKVIRSDNGSPFAAHNSPLGISRLSAVWMSLGILPDRIKPGTPSQNGSHERMHRDLKKDVQKEYTGTVQYYQNIIDEWNNDYNNLRPHEALGMQTPASVYTSSPRKFNGFVDEIIYPSGFERRKVDKNGIIHWENQLINVSSAFQGFHVGIKYIDEYILQVWFSDFIIGEIDLVSLSFYTVSDK